jgi:hypothetical protein
MAEKVAKLGLARVVSFEGVGKERIDRMKREMEDGEPPEGLDATEVIILHDPDSERSLAITFFNNADDYQRGDEILTSMPGPDAPGRRTSVTKYDVAIRMTR